MNLQGELLYGKGFWGWLFVGIGLVWLLCRVLFLYVWLDVGFSLLLAWLLLYFLKIMLILRFAHSDQIVNKFVYITFKNIFIYKTCFITSLLCLDEKDWKILIWWIIIIDWLVKMKAAMRKLGRDTI